MATKYCIPVNKLRNYLRYYRRSGCLIWIDRGPSQIPHDGARKSWNAKFAGAVAGSTRHDGYINIPIEGNSFPAHRIAWALHYGAWPKHSIDHINGNRADNRIDNLREAMPWQNSHNAKKMSGQSLPKGVRLMDERYKTKRYSGRVQFRGKRFVTACFETPEQADRALRGLREKLHGDFCRHE